jgi:hypothetical protein
LLFAHTSSTCAVQAMVSFVMHEGGPAQCPTPLESGVHVAEQQSEAAPQISPRTRHPWRSAQRCWPSLAFEHTLLQQSPLPAHDSPAGLHAALVGTQSPASPHWFAQQSAPAVHELPANVHSGWELQA